jgi:hypothetical protein
MIVVDGESLPVVLGTLLAKIFQKLLTTTMA